MYLTMVVGVLALQGSFNEHIAGKEFDASPPPFWVSESVFKERFGHCLMGFGFLFVRCACSAEARGEGDRGEEGRATGEGVLDSRRGKHHHG